MQKLNTRLLTLGASGMRGVVGTGLTPDPLCSLSEEDEQKLLAGQLEPQEDEQLQAAIQAMEK